MQESRSSPSAFSKTQTATSSPRKKTESFWSTESNDESDEDDPWYESIRQQQEELLKQKAKNQLDSDENESSDNESKDGDQNNEDQALQPDVDINEVLALK